MLAPVPRQILSQSFTNTCFSFFFLRRGMRVIPLEGWVRLLGLCLCVCVFKGSIFLCLEGNFKCLVEGSLKKVRSLPSKLLGISKSLGHCRFVQSTNLKSVIIEVRVSQFKQLIKRREREEMYVVLREVKSTFTW